jgi:uncharacterized delta-60 repeat protein
MQNLTNENERQTETVCSALVTASSYAEAFWRRMKGRLFVIVLTAALVLAGALGEAKAGGGDLDAYFGNGGQISMDLSGSNDYVRAVASQPDGKVIVVGSAGSSSVVVRFNKNGQLDTTFGAGGKLLPAPLVYAGAVTLQPDGKILVAGNAGGGFSVARLNGDGSLDNSFGNGGVAPALTFNGHSGIANAIILQPDGKIVLAGNVSIAYRDSDFGVGRYNSDGSPDLSFGTGGAVSTSFSGSRDQAYAVALQSDGKIVLSGDTVAGSNTVDFALARYNTDGTLDASFDGDGKLTTNFFWENAARAYGVAIQPDGRIVAAGWAGVLGDFRFGLARYNANGQLDASFGQGGRVTLTFPGSSRADGLSLALQPDGKILVGGDVLSGNYSFALARFNANGSLDQGFGAGGLVTTDFGGDDTAYAMSLQRNGRIILAGQTGEYPNYDLAVACYTNDLIWRRPSADFDSDGKTDFAVFRPTDGFWYVLRQTGGSTFTQFGTSGDIPVPGDFDGDGRADIAVWRESTGTFYVLNSSTNTFTAQQWGQTGDDPTVTRDYDGDGRADFAVYRRGATATDTSYWYILQSSDNSFRAVPWGLGSDLPAPGDYDGDGRADLSVKRNGASGTDAAYFYTLMSANNSLSAAQWGFSSDQSVAGDYDGDGRTDIAVWRPSNGTFYIIKSSDGSLLSGQWGLSNDRVVPGDYDGDGYWDFAVWRPSDGTFYVLKTSGGFMFQQWGTAGDMPAAFYGTH